MADLFDPAVVFRRIRNWSRGGQGWIGMTTLIFQMGWREARTKAAVRILVDNGSIKLSVMFLVPQYIVTDAGISRYEGAAHG